MKILYKNTLYAIAILTTMHVKGDVKTTLHIANNAPYPVTINLQSAYDKVLPFSDETRHQHSNIDLASGDTSSWTYQGGLEKINVINTSSSNNPSTFKNIGNAKNPIYIKFLTISDSTTTPGTPVIKVIKKN